MLPLLLLAVLPCMLQLLASPVSGASLLSSPSGLSVTSPLLVQGVDVGSTLSSLQSRLESQQTRLDEQQSRQEDQQQQIDELAKRNVSTTTLLQQYEQRFEQLQQSFTAVQNVIEQQQASLTEQYTRIEQLLQNGTGGNGNFTMVLLQQQAALNQQQSALNQQQSILDRLVERNSTIERRLSSVEEQVGPLLQGDAELEALLRQVNQSLSHELEQQDGQLTLINTKLDGLQASEITLGLKLDQQATRITQINGTITQSFTQQGSQLAQLGGQVAQVGQSVAQQGGQLSQLNQSLSQSLAQQGGQIAQLGGQITQVGQSVAQQGSQLGTLQQLLNQSLTQQGQLTTSVGALLNHSAVASVPECIALTVRAGAGGSVSVASPPSSGGCPAGFYTSGTSVTVTAVPSSGFEFAQWSGAVAGPSSTVTVTLQGSALSLFAGFRSESAPAALPDLVLGQPNFNSRVVANPAVAKGGLNGPTGVAVAANGDVYVADALSNRVLIFAPDTAEPYAVIGQANFSVVSANRGLGTSAYGLRSPQGLALDAAGGLLVADTQNNRVLYFPPGATSTTLATRVYGQSGSFTSYTASTTANGLYQPTAIAIGAGGVFIADGSNFRVLFYPDTSTTATRVIGQSGFTTGYAQSVSATSTNQPRGLAVDPSGGLYVAMYTRVLYFPSGASRASRVIGQPDYVAENTLATQQGLYNPYGVTLRGNSLYVADYSSNRVMRFVANETNNYPLADRAWVHYDSFSGSSGDAAALPQSFFKPQSVAFDAAGRMFVADSSNNRVVRYSSLA